MSISLQARLWRALFKIFFKNRRMTVAELRSSRQAQKNRSGESLQLEKVSLPNLSAAWLRPARAASQRVILYLHGGGYVSGNLAGYLPLCSLLAETLESDLFFPDYRLAPEHPYPAALEDAQAAYAWLRQQGYAAQNILVCGDSAGAGLSLALTLALRDSAAPLPGAVICFSPWADLTLQGQSLQTKRQAEAILNADSLREWAALYAGAANPSGPLLSPAFADFRDFPPLLILVGSEEILLDDARRVAEKARRAGVSVNLQEWPGLWHVWPVLGSLIPESRRAFQAARQFLAAHSAANFAE